MRFERCPAAAAGELSAAHPPREAMRRWLAQLAAYDRFAAPQNF